MHLLLDQTKISSNESESNYLKYIKQNRINDKLNGRSLFLPIENRNCEEANIPEYLCGCDISFDVNLNNSLVIKAAKFMIAHINNKTIGNHKDKCMELSYGSVKDAQIYKNKNKLSVVFETLPNNGMFDGTVVIQNKKFELLGKIVRINTYGVSSACIKDYYLKNFCFCKDFYQKHKKKRLN